MFKNIKLKNCIIVFLSGAFLVFGLYNVHSVANITEGGVLGLILLIEHWFSISPAISGFVLNAVCYGIGIKVMGKSFLVYSALSVLGFSTAYGIFEQFAPVYPQIAQMPLLSAVVGAVFVGIGAGVGIKYGGASGGDDAIAMSISKLTGIGIEKVYLVNDVVVLLLSLSYIPFERIMYSLVSVILSGQIIGIIQRKSVF